MGHHSHCRTTKTRTIRIPIHVFQLMSKYVAVESSTNHGTAEEKADALGISNKRFKMLERLIRNIRALDLSSSIDTYSQLATNLEAVDPSDPETIVLSQIEHEELSALLDRLSEREKFIIKVRYGFEDGVPMEMQLEDNLGQKTSLQFSDLQLNPTVTDDQFEFQVPEGVDLIAE